MPAGGAPRNQGRPLPAGNGAGLGDTAMSEPSRETLPAAETLVVGLGGTGARACLRLRERLEAAGPGAARRPLLLAVDTDRAVTAAGPEGLLLSTTAAVLDAAYRQPERFHAGWLDREALRGTRFAAGAEAGVHGSRPLARFLLLLPENRDALRARLLAWLRHRPQAPHRLVAVAAAAGGTGGALLTDLAYLAQHAAAESGTALECRALVLLPPAGERAAGTSASGAATATLLELHYYSDPHTEYRAHLAGEGENPAPFLTRAAPYRRVGLLSGGTRDGAPVALEEQVDRVAMYLVAAIAGDAGEWEQERTAREAAVQPVDADGNPQCFGTFGLEWVEYPEERLANAVYRNLLRRSIYPWLQGDEAATMAELGQAVPLRDPAALARALTGTREENADDELLKPVRSRLPWLHRALPGQWHTMDRELNEAVAAAVGTPPGPTQPARGPLAERFRELRLEAVTELRSRTSALLHRDGVNLERVARLLNEAATQLRTTADPVAAWEEARDTVKAGKERILTTVAAVRRDPFVLGWRGLALRRLAAEYERLATAYAFHALRAAALPYLPELRRQVMEPMRAWAGRIGDLAAQLAQLARAMADYESALLERLRKDEEAHRLALGMLRLPGAETPYVANSSWHLPYCRPDEEAAAIADLRRGWRELLVDHPEGLLADPGRSQLDGSADARREERLPWMLPAAYAPPAPSEAQQGAMRQALMRVDGMLRARLEDRLRTWLGGSAFARLAEQHRDPVQLEYELRRLVTAAGELPALEPPHVRPPGLPTEYAVVLLGEAKEGHAAEAPAVLRMVVEAAGRERPTRVVRGRSPHLLAAAAEHPGFSLAHCPPFLHLEEEWRAQHPGALPPFSRRDVPWRSATLVTAARLREAADVLYLGLAWKLVQATPQGALVIPQAVVAPEPGETRFPLPGLFPLAVRQLAGDAPLLAGLARAVDRVMASRGQEWCGLQFERAARGDDPLPLRFSEGEGVAEAVAARLAAHRAAARYPELVEEWARSSTGQDTAWLRAGEGYACPACGHGLGAAADALPAACPRCREPLRPELAFQVSASDGFRRIPNPYVVGTPLETRSGVFFGREDIIAQVHDRLIRPAQRTILILIGERRCGKTSALRQLQYRLEGDLVPLFIDMQGLTATDLQGFLWWLSWRMKEALDERGVAVQLPSFEEFQSGPPDYQFESVVLPAVRRALGGRRVLLMLDEFEVLAQRVMNNSFDARAFDYIRHLMQHGEGIEFLFAGTHVLRQFAANYVTFLFNIGVFINVDFLRRDDAVRLIREPVAHAGVTFTPDALEAVLELAGAHAYFTQMFGFHLVERLNRLRKREVTRTDVEEESGPVIAAAGAHLDHLWGQLGPAERLLIAFFVEQCPRGERLAENELLAALIREDSTVRPFVFRTALEKLMAVGLLRATEITDADGRPARALSLTAEVYREWLRRAHPFSRLREEGLTWE